MKKTMALAMSALVFLTVAGMVAATSATVGSAQTAICDILQNLKTLLYAIAGGIAVVVITLQGIKWIGSAEDPGARKQAKQGIIHAVVGLVVVLLAIWIVMLVFGSTCNVS